MKELILLNIGNTHTLMVRATGRQLSSVEKRSTQEFVTAGTQCGLLSAYPKLPVLAACVVPHAATCLRQRWPERRLEFLSAAWVNEFDFSLVTAESIGADRIANAVAALELVDPPFIVLDCGTAMTTVAVDGQRRFRGGAILPGRRLLRLALHEHTAQLPEVALEGQCPVALGTTTEKAILAGTDMGIAGAVQFLLENTRAELETCSCPVLVTGGDAAYFLASVPDLMPTPPDFIFRGLARIAGRIGAE